jgi:flagellar transcriptional activator FlhD
MNSDGTLDSIREMNLSYLSLAQRLLREDRAMGMARLSLSSWLADILATLSLAQIVKLAAASHVLCAFRFRDHTVLSALTHVDRKADVAPTPTPILSGVQPIEQCA